MPDDVIAWGPAAAFDVALLAIALAVMAVWVGALIKRREQEAERRRQHLNGVTRIVSLSRVRAAWFQLLTWGAMAAVGVLACVTDLGALSRWPGVAVSTALFAVALVGQIWSTRYSDRITGDILSEVSRETHSDGD